MATYLNPEFHAYLDESEKDKVESELMKEIPIRSLSHATGKLIKLQ